MDFLQGPLTSEQLAAVQAGDGVSRVEDPNTHRVYLLIEQSVSPMIDDEYVRAKIEEAYAEGDFAALDMQTIKAEFLRRQIEKRRSAP